MALGRAGRDILNLEGTINRCEGRSKRRPKLDPKWLWVLSEPSGHFADRYGAKVSTRPQ